MGKGLTAMQEVPGSNPTEGKKIFFSFSELEKSSFSSQSLYLDMPFFIFACPQGTLKD